MNKQKKCTIMCKSEVHFLFPKSAPAV